MNMNKKANIGDLLMTIVFIIVFFATYPFMQSAFDVAADANTGFVAEAIGFIPFIILFAVIGMIIKLKGGGGSE